MAYTPAFESGDFAPAVTDTIMQIIIAFGSLAVLVALSLIFVWMFKKRR